MRLQYVFIPGFLGWGSYDDRYRKIPYWGMRGGDLISQLNEEGVSAFAASVSPKGSSWDRACELYAQIFGTRVDYGAAHSREYHHERYGRDYTDCPLIPHWDDDMGLVLIGHSFGGVTARLFAHLMEYGDEVERDETQDGSISPLFRGGAGSRIHSVAAIASAMNGNSVYTMLEDPEFDPDAVKVSWKSRFFGRLYERYARKQPENPDPRDRAEYDMHIDRALAMNRTIKDLANVYYFSVPCSLTVKTENGTYTPLKEMSAVFSMRSAQMGRYTGVTKGGFVIDQEWQQNDGRVSTISEIAPFDSKKKSLGPHDTPEAGVWNVYPVYHGDHMSLQGGMRRKNDIRGFYRDFIRLAQSLLR